MFGGYVWRLRQLLGTVSRSFILLPRRQPTRGDTLAGGGLGEEGLRTHRKRQPVAKCLFKILWESARSLPFLPFRKLLLRW